MELTLSSESLAIISIGIVVLIAVVTGHIAQVRRTGKLPTREELHTAIDSTREELHTAIQDSEQRIIKALINHRHHQPDGPPVFTEPV
jgi:sensor domain CHASE-containing protein